jgi:hypothetical protein
LCSKTISIHSIQTDAASYIPDVYGVFCADSGAEQPVEFQPSSFLELQKLRCCSVSEITFDCREELYRLGSLNIHALGESLQRCRGYRANILYNRGGTVGVFIFNGKLS